jgi:hypothetical protein
LLIVDVVDGVVAVAAADFGLAVGVVVGVELRRGVGSAGDHRLALGRLQDRLGYYLHCYCSEIGKAASSPDRRAICM